MKKGLLIILLLCLFGCNKNSDNEKNGIILQKTDFSSFCEEYKATRAIQEAFHEKGCEYFDYDNRCGFDYEAYLGFDPYLAENIVAKGGQYSNEEKLTDNSTYQSILVNNFYIYLENGKLFSIDIHSGKKVEYQADFDFKTLAVSSACDGVADIKALTTAGEIYQIEAYESYEFGKAETHFSLEPLKLDEKVSALAVKEYACVDATCGNMKIYAVDEQGIERTIITNTDELGNKTYQLAEATIDTEYTDYITLSSNDDGEYPKTFLILMLNKKVCIGEQADYELELQEPLKNDDGEFILAEDIVWKKSENANTVYILGQDGVAYLYGEEIKQIGSWTKKAHQEESITEYTIILDTGKEIKISKNSYRQCL